MQHRTLHVVWATHRRVKILPSSLDAWFAHTMIDLTPSAQTHLRCAGFGDDHAHLLLDIELHTDVSAVVGRIKGGSAFLANKLGLLPAKLRWQKHFWAQFVPRNREQVVAAYIRRQRQHHASLFHVVEPWEVEVPWIER